MSKKLTYLIPFILVLCLLQTSAALMIRTSPRDFQSSFQQGLFSQY